MRTRDEEKQQRIKKAIVRLILREGINGASISKIAQEAGVSPATIYVYYTSKEDMLSAVYRECSMQSYRFLMRRIAEEMDAAQLIDAIIRGYFEYTVEHEEVFSFVEQCSHCPTISPIVSEKDCTCEIFDLLHARQKKGEIRSYSDASLAAVLFPPVRYLAVNRRTLENTERELGELVRMLQVLLIE